MSISEITLYKALRNKLGDETASELVEFVKNEVKSGTANQDGCFFK